MKWIMYWTADMKSSEAEFLRFLYATAKIVFITVRIIASLDLIIETNGHK